VADELQSLTSGAVKKGDELPPLSYDVSATTIILGAMASRDWRPMHHDKDFAINRNGTRDIFMNTPNQAAWFERYLTDWSGPKGRIGRVGFRMTDSVFPGDTMVFRGMVTRVSTDDVGCAWVDLDVKLAVGDRIVTSCAARIALPTSPEDNPWRRRADRWRP
jgi:acyl dehydratase